MESGLRKGLEGAWRVGDPLRRAGKGFARKAEQSSQGLCSLGPMNLRVVVCVYFSDFPWSLLGFGCALAALQGRPHHGIFL